MSDPANIPLIVPLRSPLGGALSRIRGRRFAGASAAETSYLLRATFTGANQALANAETLGITGSGATHEGYVDEGGNLTVIESADGTVSVTSNALVLTSPTANFYAAGVISEAITRAAGQVIKFTANITAVTTGTTGVQFHLMDTATTPGGSNRILQFTFQDSTTTTIPVLTGYSPAGTQANAFSITDETFSVGTTYEFDIVLGGFDSAGAVSASGEYGAHLFAKLSGSWVLLAATPSLNTATQYHFWNAIPNSGQQTHTFDTLKVDDEVTTVFTPANYVFDGYTGTGDLSDHTADSGQSYTLESGTSPTISSGKLNLDQSGHCVLTMGADFHCHATFNRGTGTGGVINFRFLNASNRNFLYMNQGGGTLGLWTVVGGSAVEQATTAVTWSASTDYLLSLKAFGTSMIGWASPDKKVTYTGSENQTETLGGPRSVTTTGGGTVDNFYVRTRTATAYADLDDI